MDAKHEIFHKPNEVKLTFEDAPTPSNYQGYIESKDLGPTLKVWPVQTAKAGRDCDFGVVSDPYGFEDSPDAEIIASGLNSKGPRSVAIGRHGPFLMWGFSGGPGQMTPEARQVFVNAVAYIRRFDRVEPIVRRTARSREWIRNYLIMAERAKIPSLLNTWFPERLVTAFGTDIARYRAFFDAQLNSVYFNPEKGGFDIDPDLILVGGSNRDPEMLERCVTMMEKNDSADLALRLLRRYTTESYGDAKEWRGWLNRNKRRLFFSDVGGFKFYVNPGPPVGRAAVK